MSEQEQELIAQVQTKAEQDARDVEEAAIVLYTALNTAIGMLRDDPTSISSVVQMLTRVREGVAPIVGTLDASSLEFTDDDPDLVATLRDTSAAPVIHVGTTDLDDLFDAAFPKDYDDEDV